MYHTLYMKTAHSLKVDTSKKFSRNFEFFIEVSLGGAISTYANFQIKIQKYEYFEKREPCRSLQKIELKKFNQIFIEIQICYSSH